MDDGDADALGRTVKRGGDAGEVVVQRLDLRPVGLMIAEGRRVVALSPAGEAVERQVRTEERHAVGEMPVGHPLEVLEGGRVPRDAEQLAECNGRAGLVEAAGYLLHRQRGNLRVAQVINPGHLHVLVVDHDRSPRGPDQPEEAVFAVVVSGQCDAVFLAPLTQRNRERFKEDLVDHPPIALAEFSRTGAVQKQPRQPVGHRLAVLGLEPLGEVVGIRQRRGAATGVRFVRENRSDFLAKMLAELLGVSVEGEFQELFGDFRFQQVAVALAAPPAALGVGVTADVEHLVIGRADLASLDAFEPFDRPAPASAETIVAQPLALGILARGRAEIAEHEASAESVVGRRDLPAGVAGRPEVLVVEIDVRPGFFGDLQDAVETLEPDLAHVGTRQSVATVKEAAGVSVGDQIAGLPLDLVGIEHVVNRPEGRGTKTRFRIAERGEIKHVTLPCGKRTD